MTQQNLENGLVRVDYGVEVRLTPMGRRMDVWDKFHMAVVLGVHTHNRNTDPQSGNFVAVAIPQCDLEANAHEKVGEVFTLFGSQEALTDILENAPQLDKAFRQRICTHGEIRPASELRAGMAFIRERSGDRARHYQKIKEADRAKDIRRNRGRVISMQMPKFPLHIQPLQGEAKAEGLVSTYGFSTKRDPLYL